MYLNTFLCIYQCIYNLICMYLNTFLVHLNILNGEKFKCSTVTRQLVFWAQYNYEPVPTYITGNYITLSFYLLSTILN